MKALLLAGGREGHRPMDFSDRATALLEGEGFEVAIHEDLDVLTDLTGPLRNNPDWIFFTSRLGARWGLT